MKTISIPLPDFFVERLRRCALANGSTSTATYLVRMIVAHVAAFEATEFVESELLERKPMSAPKPTSKPASLSSPWLAGDATQYGKGGRP